MRKPKKLIDKIKRMFYNVVLKRLFERWRKMNTILMIMAVWILILLVPALSFHKVTAYIRKYSKYQLLMARRQKIQSMKIAHN